MKIRHVASITLTVLATATIVASSSADSNATPHDVELTKPLGFRTKPGVDASVPFVLAHEHYLPASSFVTLTGTVVTSKGAAATKGDADAFCQAEYEGHHGWLHCDAASVAVMKPAAPGFRHKNSYGVTCADGRDNWAACKKFCASVCDANGDCSRMPTSGDGLMDKNSPTLKAVPKLSHVHTASDRCEKGVCHTMHTACSKDADCFVRATQEAIDGLRKVDELLATPAYAGYSLEVTNCWRDGVWESKEECYFVVKGKNPVSEMMLAWPGANPHSSGHACDVYLYKHGKEVLGHGVPDKAKNSCTNMEGAKDASRTLDELMTKSGAKRLIYEPWHFEWNGGNGCRCEAPACNDKYWPPACTSSQCN
jgi:D-alanyl-D-alanine dipeptidase